MTINSKEKASEEASRGQNLTSEAIAERDGLLIPEQDESGYRILERPMGTKRKVKVILMGAGMASMNFFKKAEEEMENLDIVCYEKNHDVGGTVGRVNPRGGLGSTY